MKIWEFDIYHKTLFLANRKVRTNKGNLENKLIELQNEGFNLEEIHRLKLIEVD